MAGIQRSEKVYLIRLIGSALVALALLLLLAPNGALAQSTTTVELLPPGIDVAEAINPNTDIPADFASAASKPPLPIRQPMVGPVFKRATWEWSEVDRWTTAFLPAPEALAPDFDMPDEEKWIRVDLGDQILVAYEGSKPVRAFIISSGLPRTPTVTGEFRIRMKVRSQTMSGGDPALGNDYSLPNVEWVQYFHQDYGFHGTYWHKDFGQPKSHGCVNMTNADAKWLFEWAGPYWEDQGVWQRSTEENPGTLVIVHE